MQHPVSLADCAAQVVAMKTFYEQTDVSMSQLSTAASKTTDATVLSQSLASTVEQKVGADTFARCPVKSI